MVCECEERTNNKFSFSYENIVNDFIGINDNLDIFSRNIELSKNQMCFLIAFISSSKLKVFNELLNSFKSESFSEFKKVVLESLNEQQQDNFIIY